MLCGVVEYEEVWCGILWRGVVWCGVVGVDVGVVWAGRWYTEF